MNAEAGRETQGDERLPLDAADPPVFPMLCAACGSSLNEPTDRCPFCGTAILLGPVYEPPKGPLARIIAWLLLIVLLVSMFAVFWLSLP